MTKSTCKEINLQNKNKNSVIFRDLSCLNILWKNIGEKHTRNNSLGAGGYDGCSDKYQSNVCSDR